MADDFEQWTFDDDFVRGGRHEPAARTRDAIARHGGERTSWRQPGSPHLERPGGGRRRQRRRHRGRSRLVVIAVCIAAAGGVAAFLLTDGPDPSPAAVASVADVPTISAGPSLPANATTTGPDSSVSGLDEATPVGTCLTAPPGQVRSTYRGSVDLSEVKCTAPHYYELVAHVDAANMARFPPESYWDGPVTRACATAFVRYAGTRAHGIPRLDGRSSSYFRPRPLGWAQGDRAVYCVAGSALPHSASVRGR